jgi:hypothetical protein
MKFTVNDTIAKINNRNPRIFPDCFTFPNMIQYDQIFHDEALYASKRKGRDRMELAPLPPGR